MCLIACAKSPCTLTISLTLLFVNILLLSTIYLQIPICIMHVLPDVLHILTQQFQFYISTCNPASGELNNKCDKGYQFAVILDCSLCLSSKMHIVSL